MNKYELLLDDVLLIDEAILYRIRALKDFSDVKAGDLGGYVGNEANLSQYGNCWLYDAAAAFENARIFWDAKMYNESMVYGNARIFGRAILCNEVQIHKGWISGNAILKGNVITEGYSYNLNGFITPLFEKQWADKVKGNGRSSVAPPF